MAGHSKWANIQHRKGRQDAKRGKVFTKLIKEITVASRLGGADAAMNPRLRLAMDKAAEAKLTEALEKVLTSPEHKKKGEALSLQVDVIKGAAYGKFLKENEESTKKLMGW